MPRGNSDARALNKFKVPQKAWGSWTLVGRHTFNKLYETMKDSPWIFLKDREAPDDWNVTAWNAAFIAAGIVSRGERHLLKDTTPRLVG